MEQWRARFLPRKKTEREQYFPLELIEEAYKIRVEDGQASVPEDRSRILNSIAGKRLESEPELQHPAYTDVNRIQFCYINNAD